MPLAQAQGDYSTGLQTGIIAGYNVIKALLADDNAAYEAAAHSWNSLVKTTFDPSVAGAYLLPVDNTTKQLVLGGMDSQGKIMIKPSHSFDSSVIGELGGEWQPSPMILGYERHLAP